MELVRATTPKTAALLPEESDEGSTTDVNQQCQISAPNANLPTWSRGSSSSTRAARSYILAASTAVLLCILCPQSNIWSRTDGSIVMKNLSELMLTYLLVLISFLMVYNSDPGYITTKVAESLDHQDTLQNKDPFMEEATTSTSFTQQEGESETQKLFNDPYGDNNESYPPKMVQDTNFDDNNLQPQQEQQCPSVYFNDSYYSSVYRSRYCHECHLYPPIRSHHCRYCGRCVATFDHHCSFIGTCIGERNHCRFYSFLSCQTLGFIHCIYIVNSSAGYTTMENNDTSTWIFLSVLAIKAYLYPLTFISLVLWFTHSWLALSNVTTFECGKGSRHIDYLRGTRLCDTPFSKGLYANLKLFCCQRDDIASHILPHHVNDRQRQSTKWSPILWSPPSEMLKTRQSG